jgi:hypothetical protein
VTVYSGHAGQPDATWWVAATGRTDAQGRYRVAFIGDGTYIVKIEQPQYPFLDAVVTPNVVVTIGQTTTVSASLPEAGAGGDPYIRISGPTSVGVGGSITLLVAVGDDSGSAVTSPSITWTSSDTTIAGLTAVAESALVTGRRAGLATIYAASGGLTDSLTVQVVGSAGPVATVAVVPESATVMVGDTGVLLAVVLRDSAGDVIYFRGASWFTADTSVLYLYPCGQCSHDRVLGRAPGIGTVYATSEGKTGRATIRVQ